MTPELTPDVRQLLEAIHAAMDVPLPALTDEAARAHLRVATDRIMTAHVALSGVLGGMKPSTAAEYISSRTAGTPATYAVWSDTDR